MLGGVSDSYFRLNWQYTTGFIVPSSGRGILLVPWDADVVFPGVGLFSGNLEFNSLMDFPEYERTFYRHPHDIRTTS